MKTTLDEMQVFIAIVDSGSITAAADVLGQTVSAASRTMSRLEEKLQTTLMRRTTRRLELTEEGRAYLEQARKIVAAVEESEELMSLRRNQPAGRLRVDAASPFMLHVIAPLVPGYRKRYPQVELELNSNEGNIDLLERRTDLAIRIGRLKDSSLHAVPLGHSRVRVLASPGYLGVHGTPRRVADLASHILLGFSQLEALNEWPLLEADGQALHIKPHVRAFSGETLRQLALNDGGVVCLSDFMTRGDRASGALQQLLVKQTQDVRQPINAVYYRNTAISSRIKSFIDYMVQALGPRGFE
ncbi:MULTISPECIES: LysR substrate-binding domain-containing protein [Achromobacter]|uniref:LysR family transcriptional regulator n=1 Tax=Alcaligenes xylosoxydans xylosoxydans TaxID=85698 RepID=A0A424WFR1_ALCXX|nr:MULTISPECIES: LysR substrate-binding domain-containing protein [Achromobacter]MBC9905816.1 LysR family transcriptional regulator [Achromobacter xylosoxidans]MBD0869299.1 LysR family transcriptional regulator [Achromobacter xylosoxidans]MDH1299014.1 LysR substrate-binding domain-containing protein [Achromobacter sp. GD03932]QNP86187.1 LysR family transcriptional regulator [Achromobacter xylosoxidans]RPJ92095.1 LysR family transcriptional regulator [Achromobacter xylosoxidans]